MEIVYDATDFDVKLGRGKASALWKGNSSVIEKYRCGYVKMPQLEKDQIVKQVIENLGDETRFLEPRDDPPGGYIVQSKYQSKQKIKQALREKPSAHKQKVKKRKFFSNPNEERRCIQDALRRGGAPDSYSEMALSGMDQVASVSPPQNPMPMPLGKPFARQSPLIMCANHTFALDDVAGSTLISPTGSSSQGSWTLATHPGWRHQFSLQGWPSLNVNLPPNSNPPTSLAVVAHPIVAPSLFPTNHPNPNLGNQAFDILAALAASIPTQLGPLNPTLHSLPSKMSASKTSLGSKNSSQPLDGVALQTQRLDGLAAVAAGFPKVTQPPSIVAALPSSKHRDINVVVAGNQDGKKTCFGANPVIREHERTEHRVALPPSQTLLDRAASYLVARSADDIAHLSTLAAKRPTARRPPKHILDFCEILLRDKMRN